MLKMKKFLASILALAMVLGMTLAVNAAEEGVNPYTADITVTGLTAGEAKTVNVYAAITLDADANNWVVADWAAPYVEIQGS